MYIFRSLCNVRSRFAVKWPRFYSTVLRRTGRDANYYFADNILTNQKLPDPLFLAAKQLQLYVEVSRELGQAFVHDQPSRLCGCYLTQFRENFWVFVIAARARNIKCEGGAIIRSSGHDAALRLGYSFRRGRVYAYVCVSFLGWSGDPKIVFVRAGRVQGEG